MADIVAGLVCEGVTDYTIIEHLLSEVAQVDGHSLTFKRLHPAYDATSGAVESGGWYTVLQWCIRNPPAIRQNIFDFGDLFSTGSTRACDLLIVHLDTDVSERIVDARLEVLNHIQMSDFDLSIPEKRAAFIKAVITHWLGMENENADFRQKHILAPAVECSEAWLLSHREDIEDVESDRGIMSRFVDLVCQTLHQKKPENIRDFRKNERRYRNFMRRIPIDVCLTRMRCSQFDSLCRDVFER